MSKQDYYRRSVFIGWIVLLQAVVVMYVVTFLRAMIDNDFTDFIRHPGHGGANLMIVVMTIYLFIPVLVKIADWVIFRWVIFGVSIFFFLFFVAHQLTHMIMDGIPLNMAHLVDFAHHIIALWVIYSAFKWARSRESVQVNA
jgi:hypothetical protein